MDSLTKQHLSLLRAHCQEWKAFFAAQLTLKRSLDEQHRNERLKLLLYHKDVHEYIAVTCQHDSELMEFRAAYEEEMWCIQSKHSQEESALLFRLSQG